MSWLTFRTARAQLSALLLLLLLFAALAVGVTAGSAHARAEGERAVELAAHLRQFALELNYLTLTDPPALASARLGGAFEAAVALLRDGGDLGGLAGLSGRLPAEDDPATLAQLARLEADWARFDAAAATLAALSPADPRHAEAVRAVAGASLAVATDLDQLQESYSRALEAEQARATAALLALLLGVLGLGLWGALLIRRRVLRPAELLAAVRPAAPVGRLAAYDDELPELLRVFEAVGPQFAAARAGVGSEDALRLAAFEASRAVVEQREVGHVVEVTTARARAIAGADRSTVCLYGREAADLGVAQGAPVTLIGDQVVPQGLGGCPTCAYALPNSGEQRAAIALQASGARVGALCVARAGTRPFAEADLRALEVLGQAAGIAITHIRLTRAGQDDAERSAARAERARLAAELHDNLAQTLTYLSLGVERVREKVAAHASDDALEEIAHVATTTREAYSTVRTVLSGLRAEPPAGTQLADAISAFVADFRRVTGLEVRLDLDAAALARLAPLAQTQALHIVREALSNVQRHAQARRASVRAAPVAGGLALLIEDDGQGFDPAAARGGERLGLAIMHMRAAQSGGELTVSAAPGTGTLVAATFPLAEEHL